MQCRYDIIDIAVLVYTLDILYIMYVYIGQVVTVRWARSGGHGHSRYH